MNEELNITGIENELVDENIEIINRFNPIINKKIAISVSINKDLENLGLSEHHLNDISIEIARYIIANGGTAIYGGDLRVNGFTNYFSELANQYKKSDDPSIRFINYFALPYSKQIDRKAEIDFKSKQIGIEIVKPNPNIAFDKEFEYKPLKKVKDRYIFCECFKAMREKMAIDCNARIIVGGKITGYLGFMPGIIEEALYTLINSKPLFIVGGFGGASQSLAKLFEGHNPEELTNEYQYSTPFLQDFKKYISDKYEFSEYSKIISTFTDFSIEKLSLTNKLSIDENRVLFSSTNIHEITYLIMKGLKKSSF
ncbi:hypothetical protein [Algibacter sp. L1A34]|uniref:hypothetical protein n=1 Tax=Algibacter sp. L1A34 TaxID=2686365 RepID=UPI00131EA9E3|nr:hypothetical protein [Algibacter sp. L1A34]